jgi:MscS family membrane protein
MALGPVLVAFVVLQALDFLDADVNLTGRVLQVAVIVAEALVAMLAVWAVARRTHAFAETILVMPRIGGQGTDGALVRLGMRIVAFVAGGLIIVYSLRHLGADMVPLLAGLGVGGLAVALAAQRTFANFIGSLILFVNKAIRVGDFCRYGDQIGTVEQIGLLATRIRSLERTIVTVPNAQFSEMDIDNFAVRDQRLLKTVLQLRYETTSEQLRYVLARLRELLLGHPKVTPAPARVRFIGYGAYSKDLEIFAYLDCADQDTFLAIQEDILLRIEDIVVEAGSGFAFPSQTAYLARDKGVDVGRRGRAEAEVNTWREQGQLPFPEFESNERQRLENRLDYPPKGSPDYMPPKHQWLRRDDASQPTFTMDDPLDIPALAASFRQKQGLAEYLHGQLSDETRALLAAYGGGRDMQLKQALVRDLNEIVRGRSLYDEHLFAKVELREQTRDLLQREPQGEDLAWLNRYLLEDAY